MTQTLINHIRLAACFIILMLLFLGATPSFAQTVVAKPTPTVVMRSDPLPPDLFLYNFVDPVSTDIDFDGNNELILPGRQNGQSRVLIYSLNGSLLYTNSFALGSGGLSDVSADQKGSHEFSLNSGGSYSLAFWPVLKNALSIIPGWPIFESILTAIPFSGITTIADLNNDNSNDYIYQSNFDTIHARSGSGLELSGWPVDTDILYDFKPYSDVAVGDINADGKKEIVFNGEWYDEQADDAGADEIFFDGVMSLERDGTGARKGTESSEAFSYDGTPTLSAPDGKIIQSYSQDFETPSDSWSEGGAVIFNKSTNALSRSARRTIGEIDSLPEYSPVIADVSSAASGREMLIVDAGFYSDADSLLVYPYARIHAFRFSVSSELPGWPINIPNSNGVSGPPVVGDIDGDGDQEILIGTDDGIMAWHHDAERYMMLQGLSKNISSITVGSDPNAYKIKKITNPTAGATSTAVFFDRLEQEEDLDFVYIYPGNIVLPNTAAEFDNFIYTNPPAQEITGIYKGWSVSVPGNSIQVVLRSDNVHNYYGYQITKVLSGTSRDFTKYLASIAENNGLDYQIIYGPISLGDVNKDNMLDVSYITLDKVFMINLAIPYRPEKLEWPMYLHDSNRTNTYITPQPRSASLPPELAPIGERAFIQGTPIQFTLRAVDPENQPLAFAIDSPLPPGATFNPSTKTFSWSQTMGQIGSHIIAFTVTDASGLRDSSAGKIIIEEDFAPVFPPIPDQAVKENQALELQLQATDANSEEILTFSSIALPTGATLSASGLLRWTPTFSQSGTYTIPISVTDGRNSASQSLHIIVSDLTIIYSEDFENGGSGWLYDGLWHLRASRFGTSFAYNNANNTYDTGVRNYGSLISPSLTVSPSATEAYIDFSSWSETEPGLSVDIKKIYVLVDSSPPELLGALSSNPRWQNYRFDLGRYIGKTFQIQFYFDTIDSFSNSYWGWYVDNILIVQESTGDSAPSISIVAPPSGSIYTTPQNVVFAVSASDDVGVTKVEFYDGGSLRSTDTDASNGWTFSWGVTYTANGSHTFTAKAYDAAGNSATSSPVNIVINIPPPTPKITIQQPGPYEQLGTGGPYNIIWQTQGPVVNFTLVLNQVDPNDASIIYDSQTIASNIVPPCCPQSYTWNIPTTLATGFYTIDICGAFTIEPTYLCATSEIVSIQAPFIKIINPTAGVTITHGQLYTISWDAAGISSEITLKLMKNNQIFQTIGTAGSLQRSFSWTPGTSVGTGTNIYKIYITGKTVSGTLKTNLSPAFSIVAAP